MRQRLHRLVVLALRLLQLAASALEAHSEEHEKQQQLIRALRLDSPPGLSSKVKSLENELEALRRALPPARQTPVDAYSPTKHKMDSVCANPS